MVPTQSVAFCDKWEAPFIMFLAIFPQDASLKTSIVMFSEVDISQYRSGLDLIILFHRLWHQLTLKLQEFVKHPSFSQGDGLVQVFEFIYYHPSTKWRRQCFQSCMPVNHSVHMGSLYRAFSSPYRDITCTYVPNYSGIPSGPAPPPTIEGSPLQTCFT